MPPSESIEYVPGNARLVPLAIVAIVLVAAAASAALVLELRAAPLLVILAVAALLVVGPAVAFSRRRVTVRADLENGAVHVETKLLLAGVSSRNASFASKPRVRVSEYDPNTLVIEAGGAVLTLDSIPARDRGRVRGHLTRSLEGWPARDAPEASSRDVARDETRALVVALLHRDRSLAKTSLARGAVSNGHPDACGLGAPLFLATRLDLTDLEALLRSRGATDVDLGPETRRALALLAASTGVPLDVDG